MCGEKPRTRPAHRPETTPGSEQQEPPQEGKDQTVNHDQEPPQALSKAAPEDTQPATGTASPLTTRGPGNKVMVLGN